MQFISLSKPITSKTPQGFTTSVTQRALSTPTSKSLVHYIIFLEYADGRMVEYARSNNIFIADRLVVDAVRHLYELRSRGVTV